MTPGLIAWGWIVGLARPTRRRVLAFAASWVLVAAGYGAVRWAILHPYAGTETLAPVFIGESPLTVRLTAVAALADVLRLLIFPLTLRADYAPDERTAVRDPVDPRLLAGLLAFAIWAALLVWAWRRGRKVEALGLGWVAIAYLPVANLLFPAGMLTAERTLYLPSAGVVLALAAAADRSAVWASRRRVALLAALVLVAGVRSALRVPVWRDDIALTESILEDSPRSFRGSSRQGGLLLSHRHYERALAALHRAMSVYDRDPTVFVAAADAAFTLGRPDEALGYARRADLLCRGCPGAYRFQANVARARGDAATADWLLGHADDLERP